MDIKEALSNLDSLDDSHWTSDGAPRVDVVSDMIGAVVTRAEIISVAPKFTRTNQDLDLESTELTASSSVIPDEVDEGPDLSVVKEYSEMGIPQPTKFLQETLHRIPSEALETIEDLMRRQSIEINREIEKLIDDQKSLSIISSFVKRRIKAEVPNISNAEATREYIKASGRARLERANKIKNTLGNLTLSEIAKLDPRSALDRAMAKKNSRASSRPKR